MRPRRLSRCLLLSLLLLAGACGTEPERKLSVGLEPSNDTPQNAVLRLIAAYEQKKSAEYAALFTGDFRFHFSTATDPDLAMDYAGGWARTDEDSSALHLFCGGTDAAGTEMEGASWIEVTFATTNPVADATPGRDTTRFKVLGTRVDLRIVVPPGPGETQPTTYIVANNYHRFYLVRGDAASGLGASQFADSAHWYVHDWVDETASPTGNMGPGSVRAAPARPQATVPSTWGRIKALFRFAPPPSLPRNTTPQGAVQRLVAAYEGMLGAQYAGVFTGDFTWEFSAWVDPALAQKYASGWFKTDEAISARHLFEGFSDEAGYHAGASSIDLALASTAPIDDQEGRDPTKFKVLATRVDAFVVVPPTAGQTEETRYVVVNNYHRFFLVRGDAAQGLGPDQPAGAGHWYVYRWLDETAAPFAPSREKPASQPATLGQLKAIYR